MHTPVGGDTPRLLLLLPHLPQVSARGAARSLTSICELLSESGWHVRVLCTTHAESEHPPDARFALEQLGIVVKERRHHGLEFRYAHRGLRFRALSAGRGVPRGKWETVYGRRFDLALQEELDVFGPHILFTYGMQSGDRKRQQKAIRAGTRVVFGLRNEAYLGFRDWAHLSGVVTPSRYLSDLYFADSGLRSTPLTIPMDPAETVAASHDPIFITFVNPSAGKGVHFFARLAERISVARHDLPFLVIESEGRAGTLVAAGLEAGFDLRRHENIMISSAVPLPKDIFGPARVLLVPSLREAAGRVVAEALMNGVPPIVSDRGGLAEMCGEAGTVLPIDGDEALEQWTNALIPLMDDDVLYQRESERARKAAAAFDRDRLRPQYDAFFRSILNSN